MYWRNRAGKTTLDLDPAAPLTTPLCISWRKIHTLENGTDICHPKRDISAASKSMSRAYSNVTRNNTVGYVLFNQAFSFYYLYHVFMGQVSKKIKALVCVKDLFPSVSPISFSSSVHVASYLSIIEFIFYVYLSRKFFL